VNQTDYQKLRVALATANYAYHTLTDPIMTDSEFDEQLKILRQVEAEHPEWVGAYSPTQTVGAPSAGAAKRHRYPMLSLANAFTEQDIRDFVAPIIAEFGNVVFYVDPKYDGLALDLEYHRGKLVYATTRGDGTSGDLVTDNVRQVESIPHYLHPATDAVVNVRGELYMPRVGFEAYNAKAIEEGRKTLSNPRNGAAGSIRLNDPEQVRQRPLAFAPYDLRIEGQLPTDGQGHLLNMLWLEERGFAKAPWMQSTATGVEGVLSGIARLEAIRFSLPMEIDGAVIRVCDLSICEKLGVRSRTPRWAIAYKYPAQEVVTTVDAIDVQVGRTGAITPVARLTPVRCGGVEVTNATLHNVDHIRRLDIRVGDTVVMRRAGEVVPEIVSVRPRAVELPQWQMPTQCPSCDAQLIRELGAAAVYCPNGWHCPEQLQRALEHFVSRAAFDIEGLASETIAKLIASGLVRRPADLFHLHTHGVPTLQHALDTEGTRSITKLLDAILQARQVELHRFLYALGIPDVGISTAKLLARMYGSLSAVMLARPHSLRLIPDVGDTMASTIGQWLVDVKNETVIHDLLRAGVLISDESPPSSDWHRLITPAKVAAMWRLPGLTPVVMARAQEAGLDWRTWHDPMHSRWAGVKVVRDTMNSLRQIHHDSILTNQLISLTNLLDEAPAPAVQSLPLTDRVIVITGSMELLNREQVRERLEALGAKVPSSVSKRTTEVVAGPGAGSKLTEAQSLNIPVRDEAWLINLLKEHQ
jgi:DNA ligase (NAD+)